TPAPGRSESAVQKWNLDVPREKLGELTQPSTPLPVPKFSYLHHGLLSASLTNRFQDWAHPDAKVRLRWHSDIDSAVKLADPLAEVITREGIFEGQLARFGHGLQRSFILALLQELATGDATNAPVLVLGCEEPELYQHPPQVRHVASVFQRLAQTGAQILVCTHSPLFVHGEGFEDVRLICRDSKTQAAKVHSVKFDDVAKIVADATGNRPSPKQGAAMKVAQALQPTLNEMFFTSVLVLVEGLEDAGYIASYLALTDRWEEYRRLGCHIVLASGKHSMIQTLAIANLLEIPTFTLFDGDTDKINKPEHRVKHESDNAALLKIAGYPAEAPLPNANVWKHSLVMWMEDIGSALAADIGKAEWENLHNRVKKELQIIDVADLHKNVIFIGELLASAWNAGIKFPTLDILCDVILNFARSQRLAKKVAG
ncbi:MAG: AAA family ATPase, partial [Acidobacteriia bacterium]|nr:AAA family ATPase [Terriglobia bacterium]